MDQKFRETIRINLQKHSNSKTSEDYSYTSYDDNVSDMTHSYESDSEQSTMDDVETHNADECQRPNVTSDRTFDASPLQVQNNQVANMQLIPFVKQNLEVSAMDISPRTVDMENVDSFVSMQSVKGLSGQDDYMDDEMLSLKSEKIILPKAKRQFKCETCIETFSNHAEYQQHTNTHDKNRFQCNVCNRWFARKYKLNEHQKTHNGNKAFECLLCQKRYTTQTNLDRHIGVFHKKEQPHSCITCKKTFAQLSTLRLHQSVHVNEREFCCDSCDSKFKTEVQLKLHRKRHMLTERHPKRKLSPTNAAPKKAYKPPQKPCICNECGKLFGNIALLRSHLQ